MNRLDRYIIANVLGLTAVTALGLTAIQTFIAFVSEAGELGGDFGFVELGLYIVLLVPSGLLTMLPMIALLGTLLGLGALASQGELVAMRAVGVSVLRLGRATTLAGVLLGLGAFMLGDWVAPAGQRAADTLRDVAKHGVDPNAAAGPVWLRQGNNVIHIRSLLGEDHVADVTAYTLNDDLSLAAVSQIDDGLYQDGRWRLSGIERTEFGDDRTTANSIEHADWTNEDLPPDVLRLFVLEAESLSMGGLVRLIHYMDDNGLDSGGYRLSLWRKLISPISVVVMMLLAIPFVLGPLRDSGAGQRLLIGILFGLGYWIVNEVVASTGQIYGWPPMLSAGLPTALVAVLAVWRMARFR